MSPARMREWYGGGTGGGAREVRGPSSEPLDSLKSVDPLAATLALPSLLDWAPEEKRPWVMEHLKKRWAFGPRSLVGIECITTQVATWALGARCVTFPIPYPFSRLPRHCHPRGTLYGLRRHVSILKIRRKTWPARPQGEMFLFSAQFTAR